MKVVVSGYVGKKITGIGRNLIELINNAPNNIKFTIYVNYDMVNDFIFNNSNVTIKTYNVSKESSMKNLLWTTFVFPKMVKKEKADIALIPNFTLLLFKKAPTVVIMHDLIEFNVKNKFSKKKMFYRTKIADPITAKKADHIITVSENSKKDIMKFLGISKEKISVVYNGVDRNKFKIDINTKEIIFKKKWPENYLLYVGTIDHPGKNSISLIKAYEKLRDNNDYFGKLVLAGMPGSGYEFIQNYVCESKYKDEIFFTGYINDEELVALYNNCDVFVFPSLYEGFGIPPLEALACGAKVIVSNNSSLPEVVGKIGYSVSPKDIVEMSDAILKLNKASKNSQEALDEHLKNFEWKNLSKQFFSVLSEIKND